MEQTLKAEIQASKDDGTFNEGVCDIPGVRLYPSNLVYRTFLLFFLFFYKNFSSIAYNYYTIHLIFDNF